MVKDAEPRTTLDTARLMVDFTQMKAFGQDPLILARGEGIRVTDVFGTTYIDGLSGVFTANLGHGLGFMADVAAEQMRQIAFTAPTGSSGRIVAPTLARRWRRNRRQASLPARGARTIASPADPPGVVPAAASIVPDACAIDRPSVGTHGIAIL